MHAPTTTTSGFTALLILLLTTTTTHAAPAAASALALFPPWRATDWTASDDSIRGGASQSYFEILNSFSSSSSSSSNSTSPDIVARFYGTLDYQALGGSGFASQRTVDGWAGVDLSAYDRVVLEVVSITATATAGGKNKTYSLNLKDTIPETVNGVEQAGISWEYNFQVAAAAAGSAATTETGTTTYEQVEVLFEDLVPTYRGSVLNDTTPLNLAAIKRVNFMIRRYVLAVLVFSSCPWNWRVNSW